MRHTANLITMIKSGKAKIEPGFIRNNDGSLELIEMSFVFDDERVNKIKNRETSNVAIELPDPPNLFTDLVKKEKNKLL